MQPSLRINAETGLLGVLGHPVGHSLSPKIHNAALAAQGLNFVYLAFDVTPEGLPLAIKGLRELGMRGVNLTIPHKETAMPLLDAVEPVAERAGAVNTVVNAGGRLLGANTDVAGFIAALRLVCPAGVAGLQCLLLGAGGAARAVAVGLASEGVGKIWIYNRTLSRAEKLCAAITGWTDGPACDVATAETLERVSLSVDVLINATPYGMESGVKDPIVPVDIIHSRQCVIDLVYGQTGTPLTRVAEERGAAAIDGTEMLIIQAAESYRLWTGMEPPVEVMRRSLGQ